MTNFAEAWHGWLQSDEGEKCRATNTLVPGPYLDNRLWRAFAAGWAAMQGAGPEPVGWRPIETAPLSDALPWRGKQLQILVATDKGRVFETVRSSLGVANLNGETATHWMPLPAAPSEESATQGTEPKEDKS